MGIIIGVGFLFHLAFVVGGNFVLLAATHLLLLRSYKKKHVAILSAVSLAMSIPLAWALIDATITAMPGKTYYRLMGFFDLVPLGKMAVAAGMSLVTLILALILRRQPALFLAFCLSSTSATYSSLLQEMGSFCFTERIFNAYGFSSHY